MLAFVVVIVVVTCNFVTEPIEAKERSRGPTLFCLIMRTFLTENVHFRSTPPPLSDNKRSFDCELFMSSLIMLTSHVRLVVRHYKRFF